MDFFRTHRLYHHFPTKKWPYQVGPIFRHAQIRWDASHSRSGFNHQLYTYIPILNPWAHTHPCCMAKLFSIAPADSQPISWWPRNGYFSMSTALKKSRLNGFNIIITYNVLDWKDQIHSSSGLSLFQLRQFFHQRKTVQPLSAWRSEECSDLREDCPSRSRRCGPPLGVILQCESAYARKAIKSGRLGCIMSRPY